MYANILVPVDGSETAARGLREAIKIAKALGSRIRLVHVVNEFIIDGSYGPGLHATDLFQSLRDVGASVLAHAEAAVRQEGIAVDSVLHEAIGAAAADSIVAQARTWPADLIVMGTHGRRGLARLAVGSDAEQVVRLVSLPVILVRNAPPQRAAEPAGTSAAAAA